MLNYLKAEFYRIFTKKGFYLFFGVLLGLYLLLAFITSGNIGGTALESQVQNLSLFVTLIGGGYLFSVVYNDDLSAKSLPAVIGFGNNRSTVIIVKTLLAALLNLLMYGGFLLVIHLTFMVLGLSFGWAESFRVASLGAAAVLSLIGYNVLAGVVAYGTQKATLSIVAFVLLTTGVISSLINLGLGFLHLDALSSYMLGPLGTRLVFQPSVSALFSYLIYIGIFLLASLLAFSKKDLEF